MYRCEIDRYPNADIEESYTFHLNGINVFELLLTDGLCKI